MSPKISVVIPSYNNDDTICATLDCLMRQRLPADEVFVVDDCSDTEVASVLGDRYPLVEIIRHDRNRGVQNARNTGYARVTGDYVLFLDADDLVCPEFLSVTVELLEENAEIGACFGNFYKCFDGDTMPFMARHSEVPPEVKKLERGDGLDFYLRNTGAFLPAFTLIRKTVLDDVSVDGQLFAPDVWGNEDFHLYIRILSGCAVFRIENPLGVYFLRRDSISRNQIKVWESRIVALDSLINLASDFPFTARELVILKEMRASAVRRNARLLYNDGSRKEAMSLLAAELKHSISPKNLAMFLMIASGIPLRKMNFAGIDY